MTVKLTVRTALWRAHLASVAASVDGLVPVVKGNGYGFGRDVLGPIAGELSDTVAVGTVHEVDDLAERREVVVLTPTLAAPATNDPILTVGAPEHVGALDGWRGRVLVKLASDMRRYGRGPELIDLATAAGLDVVGVSIHPPLAGTDDDHAAEIGRAMTGVPDSLPAWLSHLSPAAFATLPRDRDLRLRLGTALWHGDKHTLHLGADVLDVRPVGAGDRAGYRLGEVAGDGHLVMIGAGSANGVAPLADGRSPFHHARTRLDLHEPPHMHTSMAFIPAGTPLPEVGGWVDVQRPLIMTTVDEYEWL